MYSALHYSVFILFLSIFGPMYGPRICSSHEVTEHCVDHLSCTVQWKVVKGCTGLLFEQSTAVQWVVKPTLHQSNGRLGAWWTLQQCRWCIWSTSKNMRHRRTLLPHIFCNYQMYFSSISQIYFCRRCIWSSSKQVLLQERGAVVSICATAGHYYPISLSGGRHASLVRPHSVHHHRNCHLLQSTKSRSLPFHF